MELYLLFIAGCFLAFPLVLLTSRKIRHLMLLAIICLMLLLAFYNLSGVELGEFTALPSLEALGLAPLYFTAHPYARMAVFSFLFVGALALLYGLQVATPAEQAVSLLAVASAIGIGFAANFITLFIFWEVLTFSVAILVLLKMTPQAVALGYRLMIFHVLGGLLLLVGIMQHHAVTGSFIITVPEAGSLFFVLAIGFKAAFLPLHIWVAWAYPTASFTASVILAGLTTKVGVYAAARILPAHPAIVLMGASMAVFGVICALWQKDLRRILSCHIISQVGYMVAGVGVGTAAGIDGGLLHVVNSALYKAPLFMSAGAVLFVTGTENLRDLHHHKEDEETTPVWKSMPVAALGAVVGALAISGVPPFNGYVSKYLLKTALDGAGAAEWLLMFAGVGTVVSLCNLVYFGFIRARTCRRRELPVTMKAGIIWAAAFCLILGVWPQLMSGILPHASKLAVYSAPGVLAALQILGIGLAVFMALKGLLKKGSGVSAWLSVEGLIYQPLVNKTLLSLTLAGRLLEGFLDKVFVGALVPLGRSAEAVGRLDTLLLPQAGKSVLHRVTVLWDGAYAFVQKKVTEIQVWVRQAELATFFTLIKLDYNPRGDQVYRKLTLMSLDMSIFLVVIILVIVLSVRYLTMFAQ